MSNKHELEWLDAQAQFLETGSFQSQNPEIKSEIKDIEKYANEKDKSLLYRELLDKWRDMIKEI